VQVVALKLAKKFDGEIVSADSRQVFKHLDIGTGKDLPKNSKLIIGNPKLGGAYRVGGVHIWGYDLVSPKKEFSVARYEQIVRLVIKDIWKRNKLPILTGGTGLYIKAIIDGIDTTSFPKDEVLRKSLETHSVKDLFEMLANLDPVKSASMNLSDRNNPRRLIRAIEIAQNNVKGKSREKSKPSLGADVFLVGLVTSKPKLDKAIKKRVQKRVQSGVEGEIRKLLKMGIDWNMQSMNTLGYKQWRDHLVGKVTREEVIEKWTRDEIGYAKRQNTWFKKDTRIKWFDISKGEWIKEVESEVKKWHNG
jgi:tRNA dimethylallyltransferase